MEVEEKCLSTTDIDDRLKQYYNEGEKIKSDFDFNLLYGYENQKINFSIKTYSDSVTVYLTLVMAATNP